MATYTLKATELSQTQRERIFEREFYPLLDVVFTFARRLTNDVTQAEDLVQETFLKAWKSIDRYAEGTNAKAWLYSICRNAFINEYRSKVRQPYKVDYQDIVVYHNEDDPASSAYLSLYDELDRQLLGDEVARALNALPANYRFVILLDLEDFTYEEIAAIADVPIGTVRSRLHRARHLLAETLRSYAEAQGYSRPDEPSVQQEGESNPSNV